MTILLPLVTPEPCTSSVGEKLENECGGVGATNNAPPNTQEQEPTLAVSSGGIRARTSHQGLFKSYSDSPARAASEHANSEGRHWGSKDRL